MKLLADATRIVESERAFTTLQTVSVAVAASMTKSGGQMLQRLQSALLRQSKIE